MGTIQMRTFTSFRDFGAKFLELFKGPSMLMTMMKVDGKFREKIMLTVAMANNCYG